MAAVNVFNIFHLDFDALSKKEQLFTETILFLQLYQELIACYETENNNKESAMTNNSIIQNIITDLINNNEYSLQGLADYTGYPEEVIYDLAAGINANPTVNLTAKIIELHAVARRDLYEKLIRRVVGKLLDK